MQSLVSEKTLIKEKFQKKFAFLYDKHSLFYHVLLLIGIGLAFFGTALIFEKFTTPFSGDFAQQYYAFEYNFYDDWWTFFKTGHFPFYDSNTFLGADNVISNTYYGLFSPFTFPILFFPRSFLPHAMALVSIAKLVTGALLFRVYLKYMGVTEKSARIFSIAYAFMGWTAYYLWFNNFAEVLAFFPLILFGIEKIIREKQIWACSLGYFLMGLGNYFFLLTFGIFGVIFAGFRFFQTLKERGGWKAWKEHLTVICLGICGFAIGYLMCAAVMVPAVLGSFEISRSSTSSKYLELLKNAWNKKDYDSFFNIIFKCWHPNVIKYSTDPSDYYFMFAYPLASYFYPAMSGRYVNIIGYSAFENAGSSIFFFTPCIILMGGCLYRSFINKKVSHFISIALCVLCLFVPFFYFLSGAFTNNYGRWEIIVPTLGLLYIALNYDHKDEMPRLVIIISGIVALLGMIGTLFLALKLIKDYGRVDPESSKNYLYSLDTEWRYLIVWYEIILCIIETTLFAGLWKKKSLDLFVKLFVIGEVIVLGNVVANNHGLQDISDDVNGGLKGVADRTTLIERINKEDPSFFRMVSSVADDRHVNIPGSDNYNGLTTFHTFYNNQVDDFIHMENMMSWEESWSSHYYYKHQNLESFLGVKYYLTKDSDTTYYNPERTYEPNVPLNYSLYIHDEQNGYRIYKNDHHIDFGMSYDTLYYKHRLEDNPVRNQFYETGPSFQQTMRNEEVLFKGVVLNDEDVDEIKSQHPDVFNIEETAPELDMDYTYMNRQGVYVPYEVNESGEKVYELGIDPDEPTKYFTDEFKINPKESDAPVNKYQMVYTPSGGLETFPHSEQGTYLMLNYPIRSNRYNYNTVIWLLDEEGKTITFDELRYTEADNSYVGRALYSKVPVAKIVICPAGDAVLSRETQQIYYETYDKVIQRLDKARDNGIYDIKRNVNDFSFKTNYDKEKFVVTQLAYTGGWKLKAIDNNGSVTSLKIYNSQGGFAGFVAPTGEVAYELTYMTPGFVKWALVSAGAFLALGALTAVPIIIKKRKEKRDESLSQEPLN